MSETRDNKPKNIDKLRNRMQEIYGEIGTVYCPALNAKVHFTSEGFNHLRYEGKRERTLEIQMNKLNLVPYIQELVSLTATIQEQDERQELIHKKRYKKISKEWSAIKYWAFIAILHGKRFKVVVRRVDEGPYHFWSVIPQIRSNRFQGHRVVNNSKGDLAKD